MADIMRRFDSLEQTVAKTARDLNSQASTLHSRVGTHTHPAVPTAAVACMAGGLINTSVPPTTWTSVYLGSSVATTGWVFNGYSVSPPQAGYYLLNGSIYMQGTGGVFARWAVNGVGVAYSQVNVNSGDDSVTPAPTVVHLATTDTVALQAYQNAGAARNTLGTQTSATFVFLGT